MLKERGEAALDYLNFQRMLIIISLQINLFSAIAFLVNYFAPTPRTNLKEHEDGFSFTPFVNQTSLSNLRQDSDWHYYHIFASSLLPYLVLLTAFLFIPTCLTSGDNPPSRSSVCVWLTTIFKRTFLYSSLPQHCCGARSEPEGAQPHGDQELLPADAPPRHHQVVVQRLLHCGSLAPLQQQDDHLGQGHPSSPETPARAGLHPGCVS